MYVRTIVHVSRSKVNLTYNFYSWHLSLSFKDVTAKKADGLCSTPRMVSKYPSSSSFQMSDLVLLSTMASHWHSSLFTNLYFYIQGVFYQKEFFLLQNTQSRFASGVLEGVLGLLCPSWWHAHVVLDPRFSVVPEGLRQGFVPEGCWIS